MIVTRFVIQRKLIDEASPHICHMFIFQGRMRQIIILKNQSKKVHDFYDFIRIDFHWQVGNFLIDL